MFRHTNGYNTSLQAIVDEFAYPAITCAGGPPPGAQTEAIIRCPLYLMQRGNRLEVVWKTLGVPGEIELVDIQAAYVPIRTTV